MKVTQDEFEQYQKVQRAGPVNMANKNGVQNAANDMGLYELVAFIEDGDYYDLLMNYDKHREEFGGQ